MTPAASVLIVGQGLAGTLLAWELERAGRDFLIVDAGHAESASRVGAGLVNPVTGERWVSAPGWAEKSAAARGAFRIIESAWGVSLVRELRIRRVWRDEAEAALVRGKVARGELAPWVRAEGLEPGAAWIEGAWRVDLPALIAAGRARWKAAGKLREARLTTAEAAAWPGPVVWCAGAAEDKSPELHAVGGETLELEVAPGADWPENVVRHDGVWVLPVGTGRAWAGASFVRDETERVARREALRASVRRQLADVAWRETAILAGRRMTSPDRVPRSGWLPGREGREGIFNGLGSKGVLLAPALACDWADRLA
jgi:glycine/D-amino acid oxidase-like deaminating enzyme